MKSKQKSHRILSLVFIFFMWLSLPGIISAASNNDKYGFIDKTGEVVINPRFDQAGPFYDGLARVSINNKYGYINKRGDLVVDFQFDHVTDFLEGQAGVCVNDESFSQGLRCGIINKEGEIKKELATDFLNISLQQGLTPFLDYDTKENKKGSGDWGFKDANNKIVIPPQFEAAYGFSEGLAMVLNADNKYGFIDETGKIIIEPQYEVCGSGGNGFFKEGLAIVATSSEEAGRGKCGVIDKEGNWVVKPTFKHVAPYSEGLAAVWIKDNDSDKWGFIDKKGNMVIEPKFDIVNNFHEGLASFEDKGKYGFIDKTGEIVIPVQFDYADNFHEGLTHVKKGDKFGFIDKSGKVVIGFQFDFVSNFNEGLALFGPDMPEGYY